MAISDAPDRCSHGKTMKEECPECERIWGHSFMSEEQRMLARFYDVNTKDELIAAQAKHIEKLQNKLPPLVDREPRNPRRG